MTYTVHKPLIMLINLSLLINFGESSLVKERFPIR